MSISVVVMVYARARESEKKKKFSLTKASSRHATAVDSSRQNAMKTSLAKIVLINTCSVITGILPQNSE